ncbi:MAG: flagellar biosynthesis protein [Clostridiaceae bacterium]|nr:flagellar biosynthesis protein [Clostridiaceae bacterium]
MSFRIINGKPYSSLDIQIPKEDKKTNFSKNFKDALNNAVKKNESFLISNHAAERLQNRNISLNSADMNKINDGINMADEKGSKECLILYKDLALVTSITNRTIITAVHKESSKGNVFTNIDSVVML